MHKNKPNQTLNLKGQAVYLLFFIKTEHFYSPRKNMQSDSSDPRKQVQERWSQVQQWISTPAESISESSYYTADKCVLSD